MYQNNVVILLLLVFLPTLVSADRATSPKANKASNQQEYCLRLPFVDKLTLLPAPLEKHVFKCPDVDAQKDVATNFITGDVSWNSVNRGGGFGLSSLVPAGYNPFGYKITELGQKFLEFDGSLDSDVGRFLSSVRTRKRFDSIKSQWLEILRVSKKGQSMRIYKSLQEFIDFCLAAGFLD